jgi:sphingosine kinase
MSKKRCPIEVEYKLVDDDKYRMAKIAREIFGNTHFHDEEGKVAMEEDGSSLPWTKPVEEKSESWTKYDKPIIYLL